MLLFDWILGFFRRRREAREDDARAQAMFARDGTWNDDGTSADSPQR